MSAAPLEYLERNGEPVPRDVFNSLVDVVNHLVAVTDGGELLDSIEIGPDRLSQVTDIIRTVALVIIAIALVVIA